MIGWLILAAAVLAAGAAAFAVIATLADRHIEATNRRVIEHGRIADEGTRIERYERWLDTPPDERKWT